VTGDYLKQLQLTKQLEQRTKEAARNRKEAEEKMAESEKAIASAKSFDALTAEAEKWLQESRQANQQKDYKEALGLAAKALEAAERSKKIKVSSIIDSSLNLIHLFDPKEVPADLLASADKAQGLLNENAMETALAKARELWDASERFTNAIEADRLSLAQSLILLAESNSIVLGGEKTLLGQSRQFLDQGNHADAIAKLNECLAAVREALQREFAVRIGLHGELAENAVELGQNLAKADEIIKRSHQALEMLEFESAFELLATADKEARAAITQGLLLKFDGMKQRATVIKGYGADITSLSNDVAKGRELARSEKLNEALVGWRTLESNLRNLETEQLLRLVSAMRDRLLIAKKTGTDTAAIFDKFQEARQILVQGDFSKAAATVGAAEKLLEKSLEGYREVEAELARTKSLLLEATALQVDIQGTKRLLEISRKQTIKRDFRAAVASLHEAQDLVHSALQSSLGGDIMRAEMRVTSGLKIGADVTAESAELEETVSKVKSHHYSGVKTAIDEVITKVDGKVRQIAEKTVADATRTFESYRGPLDISAYRAALDQASEALKAGNAARAHELAAGSLKTVRKDEQNALEEQMETAKHLLAIAKDIGCESIMLNEKLARADDLRRRGAASDSLAQTAEVLQYVQSIVKDELTRRLTQLSRAVSSARRDGVEVLQADRLTEESTRALSQNDLKRSYSLLMEAEPTLEHLVASYTRLYDRILEITALLKEAEANQLDASPVIELLGVTKKLFESGRYEEAFPAAAKAFVEAEKLVAPFVAPKRVAAVKDLMQVAKRLGFDATAVEASIRSADEMLERKEWLPVMTTAREAERAIFNVLVRGAEKEMEQARGLLLKAKASGSDVIGAQQILAKAESLLEERRVYDALRAIELAKSELDQVLLMSNRSEETIIEAQAVVTDAQGFGVNTIAAQELLRQASNYAKLGRHGIAHELAKKAGDQAGQAAAELVQEQLMKLELTYHNLGLEGPDLQSALRGRSEVDQRLEAKRFREASALVKNVEMELAKVREQKELTEKSLRDLDAKVSEAKRKGLTTAPIEGTILKAKEKLGEGSFGEAFAFTVSAADVLKAQSGMFSRRSTELDDIIREAEALDDPKAIKRVKDIAEQAKRNLDASDYELATLHTRRAKAALQEGVTRSAAELLRQLGALIALAEEMRLDQKAVPIKGKNSLAAKKEGRPVELPYLRESVKEMRSLLIKHMEERRHLIEARIKEATTTGAGVSASQDFIAKAEAAIKTDNLPQAWTALQCAETHVGVALDTQRTYVDLRTNVEARIDKARKNGIELKESISLYRSAEATKAQDHSAALAKMKEALAAAERAVEDYLPDIQLDIDFVDKITVGRWSKATMRYSNKAKAMAREVNITIMGDLEARGLMPLPKLRGGEAGSMQIEVLPKKEGTLHVVLGLECRPVLSNDPVGFESSFDVNVG
jgi:hypothetical protein